MRKILYFFAVLCLFLSTGCNQESTGNGGSSAVIVVINNHEYNGTSEVLKQDDEIGEKIGTIELKTKSTEMPKERQSNFYDVGTEVYSVNGTDDYIVVKSKNNKKDLLKKVTDDVY